MCDKTEIWTLAIQHKIFTTLLQKQAEAQAWLQTVVMCGPFQVPHQTSLHPCLPGIPGNGLWDRKLHVRGLPGQCFQVQPCEVVGKAGLGGERSWSTVGKKGRPQTTLRLHRELKLRPKSYCGLSCVPTKKMKFQIPRTWSECELIWK